MRTAICGKGFEERREAEPKNGVVAKYAARAGLHMLLIGMAAWYISHGSLWQIVSIWISAFLAAVGGLAYGYWYGTKWRRQISFAGGLLLLPTGGHNDVAYDARVKRSKVHARDKALKPAKHEKVVITSGFRMLRIAGPAEHQNTFDPNIIVCTERSAGIIAGRRHYNMSKERRGGTTNEYST